MVLNPKGRNWGSLVNWDDLAKAYAGFIIAWTIVLYSGVAWMIYNRNLPFVRIRNVPIAVASVSFLHLYLIKIVLAYTTNGHFLCSAEFWIMSLYLPFGIALFQASLAQLQSVSDQQRKLLSSAGSFRSSRIGSIRTTRGLLNYWKELPQIKRTYTYIGLGMLIQVIVTAVLYATTPELRGDWSSYGNVSHAKGQALCRRSPQWIPSAIWQLLWSWFYGLYTLIKIRNIHDTHYWRLGTWLCVISGLPGTPLWIAAVFDLDFKPVNIRWVPPMWLAPGIVVMQVVTIFFPMLEAYKSRSESPFSPASSFKWGSKEASDSETSLMNANNAPTAAARRSKENLTMASLEKALAINPLPLLHFAASKDFTAENIIFLMRVKEWRQTWATAPQEPETADLTDVARALLFRLAVDIYMTCIDEQISQIPININHAVRDKLRQIFDAAVPEESKRLSADSVGSDNPFDFDAVPVSKANTRIQAEIQRITLTRQDSDKSSCSEKMLAADIEKQQAVFTAVSLDTSAATTPGSPDSEKEFVFAPHPAISPLGPARVRIPADFDAKVFDAAEESIKYLVLTNTWRKFAQAAEKHLDTV